MLQGASAAFLGPPYAPCRGFLGGFINLDMGVDFDELLRLLYDLYDFDDSDDEVEGFIEHLDNQRW